MMTLVQGPSVDTSNTTADTYRHSENTIPVHGSAVRSVIVAVTGTAHTLTNITRVTVRQGQTPFIDADPLHLAAWINFYSKAGAEWPTTATRWTIPLHGFLGGGAPRGKQFRVEHTKNATPQTGTAALHLGVDESTGATGYPMFITQAANIPASSTAYGYPITQEGHLCGITFPTANITALRVYQGRDLIMDLGSLAAILEAQNLERGVGIGTTTLYLKMPQPLPVGDGITAPQLRLAVTTGAGWATTDVIGIHTHVYYPEVLAAMAKAA